MIPHPVSPSPAQPTAGTRRCTLSGAILYRLRWLLLCGCCLCPIWSAYGAEAGFKVLDARTRLVNGVYRLDAQFDIRFTDKALEALRNGVPLTLVVDMRVVEKRRYFWWDAVVASLQQRYRLRYHALSQQYQLENLNTGVSHNFLTRHAALTALNSIKNFPLIDARLLPPGPRYKVELQLRLDINSLPVPLRPIAYVSSAWNMDSPWYTTRLRK